MIFILGGKYQGKTAYALTQYGERLKVFDLTEDSMAKMYEADVIKNVQEGVRRLLADGIQPLDYFTENIDRLEQKILIGTEIGCGIVPLEEKERIWRDETGRVYQLLAKKARKVERIWAGIPVTIKDEVVKNNNIFLIRHAKTQANFERRYTGSTDEPLAEVGIRELKEKIKAGYYPEVDRVFVSPMKRCRQTAQMIYPHLSGKVVAGFTEYDFGKFEGKTYGHLKDDPVYQKWIESGGVDKAPGGEDMESYKERCCLAFEQVLSEIREREIANTALVVHGGTIMAIMERYVPGDKVFYDWQVSNCGWHKLVMEK